MVIGFYEVKTGSQHNLYDWTYPSTKFTLYKMAQAFQNNIRPVTLVWFKIEMQKSNHMQTEKSK